MKYCRNCGNEVSDAAIICPKCGCSVDYENKMNFNNQVPTNTESYSVMSILGMVFAFVESLVGLILSIVAYNEAKNTGNTKSLSLAKAGIITSSVFLGLSVFAVILWLSVFYFSLFMGGIYYM